MGQFRKCWLMQYILIVHVCTFHTDANPKIYPKTMKQSQLVYIFFFMEAPRNQGNTACFHYCCRQIDEKQKRETFLIHFLNNQEVINKLLLVDLLKVFQWKNFVTLKLITKFTRKPKQIYKNSDQMTVHPLIVLQDQCD